MKIQFSAISNENISDIQTSAANKVVGGLELTVDANSIGITDLGGIKKVKSAWANSSVQGIVTGNQLQSEANWNGGIVS